MTDAAAVHKEPAAAASANQIAGMTREMQVKLVLKLVERGGEASAAQVRKRALKGLGVTARGLEFDASVLRQALAQWDARLHAEQNNSRPGAAGTAEAASSTLKRKSCVGSPDRAVEPNVPSPSVKRRLSRKSSVPDENVDPHATSTSGKAARAKSTSSFGVPEPAASARGAQPTSGASLPRAAKGAIPTRPTAATGASPPFEGNYNYSVKELKTMLAAQGVDCAGCVEKADLEALWGRFEMWMLRPLSELQATCEVAGGRRFGSAEECARFLASSGVPPPPPGEASRCGRASSSPTAPPPGRFAAKPWRIPPPGPARVTAAPTLAKPQVQAAAAAPAPKVEGERGQEAQTEVRRILPLRKESFRSPSMWGFAVLEVPATSRDVASVQSKYRSLMRKLHPDRAGDSPLAAKCVELIREAKEICERGLSKQEPPPAPRGLRWEVLSSQPGHRRFKLCWTAPDDRPSAPVRRYVVAAFDPAYGKALTITILEPDYSEELRRFISLEELTYYVMAEQDLQKMPKLWTQSCATVQVAASNDAGQSSWAILQVPLTERATPQSSSGVAAAGASRTADYGTTDFGAMVKKFRGVRLRQYLDGQTKAAMSYWLKSVNWSVAGAKQDLMERIIFIREAMT